VVVRLPATTAAFVATDSCTRAITGTAVTAISVASAVATVATKRQQGAANRATKRSATERYSLVVVAVVELFVRGPAPRARSQRVPVQPPVHHRVNGRMGVTDQKRGHGYQPAHGFITVAVDVVLGRRIVAVHVE